MVIFFLFSNSKILLFLAFIRNNRQENQKNNKYSYFTSSTFPHEIRFASASAHVTGFLFFGIQNISRVSGREISPGVMSNQGDGNIRTKRLMLTQLGWVSRQEVHWTLNV